MLRAAQTRQDWPSLRQTAHTIKGTSGNLGLRQMAELCLDLEEPIRDRKTDQVAMILNRLEGEFERVLEALAGVLST